MEHQAPIIEADREEVILVETPAQDRAKKIKPIKPLQWGYMKYFYNPFWFGGPLDGGDSFDGPFGGFAPNPFARPTPPPKKAASSRHDTDETDTHSLMKEVEEYEYYAYEDDENPGD